MTRHRKPANVLIGFKSEDAWFDYRLEHDPRFLHQIELARASLRAGKGLSLEQVDADDEGAEQALAPDESGQ